MPRGYRRKRRSNYKRIAALTCIPLFFLALALAWVWKADQVKESYSIMKGLETEKTNLISENMRLRADLLDLKSLSRVSAIATARFGLTQNVSSRIFINDPVAPERKDRAKFAAAVEAPGWLDDAVIGSGRVRAEPGKKKGKE
jgi:hypothetical protein